MALIETGVLSASCASALLTHNDLIESNSSCSILTLRCGHEQYRFHIARGYDKNFCQTRSEMCSTFFASVCSLDQTSRVLLWSWAPSRCKLVNRQDIAGFYPLAQRFLKSEPPDRLRNFLGVITRLRDVHKMTATPDGRTTCNRHAPARCLFAATAWRRKNSRLLSSSCSLNRNDAPRASRQPRRASPGLRDRYSIRLIFASFAAATVRTFAFICWLRLREVLSMLGRKTT